jgi:hypothetical protein
MNPDETNRLTDTNRRNVPVTSKRSSPTSTGTPSKDACEQIWRRGPRRHKHLEVRFHYLKIDLSVVLVIVGAKMLLTDVYKVPIGLSLGVVALVLLLSVIASLVFPKSAEAHSPVEHDPLAPTSLEVVAPIHGGASREG